jgi:hypothetical protein
VLRYMVNLVSEKEAHEQTLFGLAAVAGPPMLAERIAKGVR